MQDRASFQRFSPRYCAIADRALPLEPVGSLPLLVFAFAHEFTPMAFCVPFPVAGLCVAFMLWPLFGASFPGHALLYRCVDAWTLAA